MAIEDLDLRTRTALAVHGLSLAEHFVMGSVGYRVNVGPDAIARHALGAHEGDPRGSFTEDEYRAALASCIRHGLLKVLSRDDFDRAARRTHLRNTALAADESFEHYAPGHVEFTAEGYRVHQAVIAAIFGST